MWCFCAQLELSNTDCSKFPSPSERHLGRPSLLFCCTMALVVHCPAAFVMRSWRLGRQLSSVQQSTHCCIYSAADGALALGAEHTELLGSEHSSPHTRAPPRWPGAAGCLRIWRKAEALDLFQARPRSHIAYLCGLLASPSTVQGSDGASHSCLAKNSFNIPPPPFSMRRSCMRWCWETYQYLLCFLRRDLTTWRQFFSAISDCLLSRHLFYLPALLWRLPCQVCVPNAASDALTTLDSSCKPSVQAIAASFGPKQQFVSKVWLFEYPWAKL